MGSGAKSAGALPPLVVVARIVLLLVAAALAISGFALAWSDGDHAAHGSADYVCPMHPEVTSATPGECPICRMALERATSARSAHTAPATSAAAAPAPGTYVCPMHPEISSENPGRCPSCRMALEQVGAVKTEAPVPGTYVCPMHPEITSHGPGRCPTCRMALEPAGVRAAGADPITPSTHGAGGDQTSYTLAAVQVEKPPDLIGRPVRRAVVDETTAPAWIESEPGEADAAASAAGGVVSALLYNDDVPGLTEDTVGEFFLASAPTEKLAARFTGEPPVAWDKSMSKVRFRLEPRRQGSPRAAAGATAPGELGWITLPSLPHERLAVPVSALLYSSGGPYVLVVSADSRTFQKRPIVTGRIDDGFATVLSGLSADERLIVGNTFALDAERRLQQRGETGEVKP